MNLQLLVAFSKFTIILLFIMSSYNIETICVSVGREFLGIQLGRERTFQDPAGYERMRDRVVRAGGMGKDRVKEEYTKVLEYSIVIIIIGAFIESPS